MPSNKLIRIQKDCFEALEIASQKSLTNVAGDSTEKLSRAQFPEIREESGQQADVNIFVKLLSGQSIVLRISLRATVADLKEKLYLKTGVHLRCCRFTCGKEAIEGDRCLAECGVASHCTVHTNLRILGGMPTETSSAASVSENHIDDEVLRLDRKTAKEKETAANGKLKQSIALLRRDADAAAALETATLNQAAKVKKMIEKEEEAARKKAADVAFKLAAKLIKSNEVIEQKEAKAACKRKDAEAAKEKGIQFEENKRKGKNEREAETSADPARDDVQRFVDKFTGEVALFCCMVIFVHATSIFVIRAS